MGYRTLTTIVFGAVMAAELLIMLAIDSFPMLIAGGQARVLLDALMVGVCSASAYAYALSGPAQSVEKPRSPHYASPFVMFLVASGFETVFHPFSENLMRGHLPIDADLVNAVLTAAAVTGFAVWLQVAEREVARLAGESALTIRSLGSAILAGAIVSAVCVAGAAGIREVNQGLLFAEAQANAELSNTLGRLRSLAVNIGRQAMLELAGASDGQSLVNSMNAARASGQSGMLAVRKYTQHYVRDPGRLANIPSVLSLERAWNRVIGETVNFTQADGPAKGQIAQRLQDAIDEFVPVADVWVRGVSADERWAVAEANSRQGNILTGAVAFFMSIALLWPLMRLMSAQKLQIVSSLARAERLNSDLLAYQRALDEHAIVAVTDIKGNIELANDRFCEISGYERHELLGQNHRLLKSGVHPPELYDELWRTIFRGQSWRGEICNRAKDGHLYWVDTCVMPLSGADGRPEKFVSIRYDITERKRAELKAERRHRIEKRIGELRGEFVEGGSIYASLPLALAELNKLTHSSSAVVCEFGRTREGAAWGMMLGHHCVSAQEQALEVPQLLNLDAQPEIVREVMLQGALFGGLNGRELGSDKFVGFAIGGGLEPCGMLMLAQSAELERCVEEVQIFVGGLTDILSTRRDAERRKSEEEKAKLLAKRDPLTGLGNRRDLMEQFNQRVQSPDGQFAFLLIDLDRFKPINDTFGHIIGDTVLRVVAERLRSVSDGDIAVARIGGDEFAVLSEVHPGGMGSMGADLSREVLAQLTAPIECGGHSISVGASVGVAVFPRDGRAFQELLHKADAAMYRAKTNRSGAETFNAAIDDTLRRRAELESDLKAAIENGEIVPHFQPYVDLKFGHVVGHEVLARWRHKRYGDVSPSEFIHIAEESGLVDKLFWQLLRSACRKHVRAGLKTVLSMNLSPIQIRNPVFAKQLNDELLQAGFPPDLLEFEITESSMIGDVERARPLFLLLKSCGIRIALDDFGTGYSSLALLRTMPITKLKIDRSFTQDLEKNNGTGVTIVKAILGIARALDLEVTAEGVETSSVANELRAKGCHYGQGHLYAPARPEISAKVDFDGWGYHAPMHAVQSASLY